MPCRLLCFFRTRPFLETAVYGKVSSSGFPGEPTRFVFSLIRASFKKIYLIFLHDTGKSIKTEFERWGMSLLK